MISFRKANEKEVQFYGKIPNTPRTPGSNAAPHFDLRFELHFDLSPTKRARSAN